MAFGALIGGKYRLVRPLAAGGMGSVWVARHLELEVDVALKLIADADPSSAARARFRREAKAAAQLSSAHVVRIFDYGTEGEAPYIAMELLAGEDLKSRLERVGSLSLGEASAVVTQIAKALAEAHSAGLVHRDVKPRNVFLARAGGDEIVKVLDFGIAKDLTARDETQTGVLLGSPHYMSPEQARGSEVDGRSDVWSLAVVTFEMLSCEKPFPGTALGDVIARICIEPPRRLSEVAPELPAELDAVFERALAKEPVERFEGVRAFAQALGEVAADHPSAHAVRILTASPPAESDFGRTGTTAAEPLERKLDAVDRAAPLGMIASEASGTLATLTTVPRPRRGTHFGVALALAATAAVAYLAIDRDTAALEPPAAASAEASSAPVLPPPPLAPEAKSAPPVATAAEPAPPAAPMRTSAPLPPRARATASPSARPKEVVEPEVIRDDMFGVPIGVER
jgi:eukaryotic-like serine/threonine-protein kinase